MQKIIGLIRKLSNEYSLIEDGDKIAVGVSGGKDSLVLLTALKKFQEYKIKNFEIVAISVDLSGGKMDYTEIRKYCNSICVPFYLVDSDVFDVVFNIRKEKNPCSLCAKLRRGILNSKAKELGCNKVALGHHSDDLIETFLLSLVYEGRLFAFNPKTYLSNTNLYAIRPLLYVPEYLIQNEAKSLSLPVLTNICPKDHNTERERAKQILKELENNYPKIKEKILNSITNPERYSLWANKQN